VSLLLILLLRNKSTILVNNIIYLLKKLK